MISSSAKFTICSYPYNYLIIEDCFETNAAYGLSSVFNDLIRSGRSVGKVGEVGDLVYDAVNFTPTTDHVRTTPIANIASGELKALIADVFQIQLDDNVMIGMHRHNPPSKPGWTHTDFAVVSFPNVPPTHNGLRVYYDGSGCNYSDDSKDRQPETIKTARSIACLYYSANVDWKPGMGGETGVYLPDGKTLVASIPPKNNLLFAFEICPLSYHAYLGSESMQRSSFIWWYHSAPNYLLNRHAASVAARQQLGLDPWDRWTDASVEKFDTGIAK